MRITFITFVAILTWGAPSARADSPKPATAPANTPAKGQGPTAADKVSVNMTIIEPSGATLAERNVDVAVGATETITVAGQQGRTISIETTVNAGRKTGCYKVAFVVRDRRIDPTGRFNKTVWQSATEPCDPQPITLGPKEEARLRISVRRAG